MQNSIRIELLQPRDIETALDLSLTEGWNQTAADWIRLLDHQRKGCFGAYCDDHLVGTVTTSVYDKELAWLGMMLVQRDFRGSGLGRRLMLAALEYTKTEGVTTVKLDATPVGRKLYEAMEFVPEAGIERWERHGVASRVGTDSIAIKDGTVNDIYEIDRSAFGVDRATMLDSLLKQSSAQPFTVCDAAGKVCGYALARLGSRAPYVGPIVSVDPLLTPTLIDHMVRQFPDQAIYIDFYKGSVADSSLLSARGFVKQRELTRMFWGKPSSAGLSQSIFSIAGPEIG
jgi:GNAT superfamily N-acetyltransferase